MRINRETLLENLERVKVGLSPREFIEQSSCFCFKDGMVMTFNDEIACRMKIDLNITGAVQADKLLEILGKMDDPQLLVLENDEGQIEFKGKRKRFGVLKDAEIFLPIDKVEKPEKWKELPQEFTEAVGLVQKCVSTDESRFLLCCVHLHPDYIESCNNMEMMRVQCHTGLSAPVLIRGTSISNITSMGMDKISITKSWVHFKNAEGLILSCRRYVDDYPDLSAILEINEESRQITLPKGLKDAAERAAVFAMDKSGAPSIKVTLKPNRIRIRGEGLSGWFEEIKKTTYDGPGMEFLIDPDLLSYISDEYSEAEISTTKLRVVNKKKWEYVTVLGSVNEEDNGDDTEEEEPPKKKKRRSED